MSSHDYNLACDLRDAAQRHPEKPAVICAAGRDRRKRALWQSWTFERLWQETMSAAAALRLRGVEKGARVLIFMKPSLEFTAVVFALQTLGAVPVLIDPGIGLKRLLICIREAEPSVMIGIPKAHLLRFLFPAYFRSIRYSIVAGDSWLAANGVLRNAGRMHGAEQIEPAGGHPDDPGAILFTSGSTGVPKGVQLLRRHIAAQKRAWNDAFGLREDDVDLVTFPIFLLVSAASGRTCVIPEMDFSQPVKADPVKFAQAIADHAPTFCFGSPALWNKMSRYAMQRGVIWHTLRRVVIGGAPVSPDILERLRKIAPLAKSFTPFGSTEALPVCNIEAQDILNVTQYGSHAGRGTCVGFPVPGVAIRIIEIDDAALPDWSRVKFVAPGKIGEIAVSGEVVTESYFRRDLQTRLSKSVEVDCRGGKRRIWHRMGDAGYVDEQGRLWFCGRIKHIAWHAERPWHSVQVEGIFNRLQQVARSALVNVRYAQRAELALIIEPDGKLDRAGWEDLVANARQLAGLYGVPIHHYVRHDRPFPVDRRHNAKIEREKLAAWAQRRLDRAACAASTTFLCGAVAEQDKLMRRA